MLKFNEMDGPAFKMKDDPWITRVGGVSLEVINDFSKVDPTIGKW